MESPTLFWVQIEHVQEDFEELIEDLTRRIVWKNRFLRQRPHHIFLNEQIAVQVGKRWQKGIITQIDKDGIVTVALSDWNPATHLRDVLYILEDRFRETALPEIL